MRLNLFRLVSTMLKEVSHNSPAIWVLWIVGIWYPDKSSRYYNVYKLYTFGYFFMYIIHVTTMVIHVWTIYEDIEALSATFYVLSIKLIGVYKVIYILKGMFFSQELLNILEQEMFQPKDKRQENLEKLLFNGWKIRASILIFGVAVTVLFLNVWPIIDGLSNMKLPFASWYPFNYQEFPLFGIIFLFQSMGTIYAGCINVGTDTFASQIMANIQIQCDLLSDTLKNLHEYSRKNLQTVNVREDIIFENMNTMLIQCVQHHRAILRYSKDAEQLFNLGVVGQFAVSCVVMCLNMLRMSWLNPRSGEFIAMLIYQLIIVMTLLCYCWHGNEVIFSSSQISEAALKCPWYECNMEFKKNLFFFINRTQTPIVIRSLNFFPLSLISFIAIVRSSYSYYAVLRSVHEPN